MIAHGDKHAINKINQEIIIPALKDAGKTVDVILYPGQPRGFSHGSGSPEAAKKFFDDCTAFFQRHLKTQPQQMEESLVKQVPVQQ